MNDGLYKIYAVKMGKAPEELVVTDKLYKAIPLAVKYLESYQKLFIPDFVRIMILDPEWEEVKF